MLCCPDCRGTFEVNEVETIGREVERGELVCIGCGQRYPIVNSVPRFVSPENYAGSFGLQWNRFRETQLDSHTGQPISRERFFRQTGWAPEDLTRRAALDVGCGAGRFAEVALSCGATVVGVDYSAAVDACWRNLGQHDRFHVVQADIYRLPFKPGRFDFVYCFGVLQHTPDAGRAFAALPVHLRANGKLAVDAYPKQVRNMLWPKYWLRVITRRIPAPRLLWLVQQLLTVLWPVSLALGRIPYVGRRLRHVIPIANYEGIYPLSPAQLREWAFLDTFDMLSPEHDHPQSPKTVREWFDSAGLRDIEVFRAGHLVGRGVSRPDP